MARSDQRVSVVIATRNHPVALARTLDWLAGLLRQLPAALAHRQRLPDAVEADLRRPEGTVR